MGFKKIFKQIQSQSDVTTDVQSICLGVKFTVELVTRYYFLFESCCVVSVRRPLWREVGSVSCQSLSALFCPKDNLHCTCHMFYVFRILSKSWILLWWQQSLTFHYEEVLLLTQLGLEVGSNYAPLPNKPIVTSGGPRGKHLVTYCLPGFWIWTARCWLHS
jgi:hypothetical protein